MSSAMNAPGRAPEQVATSGDGKKKCKTTVIKCKHHVGPGRKLCGAERTIKVQDAFQVKRCVPHQKEYAAERRRARAKAKRQAAKEAGR